MKPTKPASDHKSERMKEEKEIHNETHQPKTVGHEQVKKQDIKSDKEGKKPKDADVKSVHAKEKEAKKRITELENHLKELQDKYLRLSAEFDNYRKRTLKEKADLIINANENLLKDILLVVDDFERGIDHIDKSEDMESLKQGIHLIYNKFSEFLRQKGIKEIEARGQPFNIDFHEAMTKIPAPTEEDKGKILDVIEKGYLLNDKVIRYAKVVIGD
jgi:molecular chaperone GrpE